MSNSRTTLNFHTMGKIEFKASEVWPKEVLPVTPAKPTPKPSPVKVSSVKATPVKATPAPEERWRNSTIHPELMVSDKGRVKAREYQLVTQDKDGKYRIYNVPAKMLETRIAQSGELMVSFTNSGGNQVTENVALMVATEFVTNDDPSIYTRLKFRDLNRGNAKASNLYWDGAGIYAKG